MAEEKEQYKPLTREELDKLAGEALPERAAMSLINANVAAPVNAALALNVLSDDSVAYATAEHIADIYQSKLTRWGGAVRTNRAAPHSSEETNMPEKQEWKPLTREELDKLAGEPLPERAAMSLINANVAAPINLALAANVASDGSIAYANAEQIADIDQSN
jgi:hypothetical protein